MSIALTGLGSMLEHCKVGSDLSEFDPHNSAIYDDADWFDPKVDCGSRGFKYFNASTRYMTAAIRQIDSPVKPADAGIESDGKGVVIGSNSCTRSDLYEFGLAITDTGTDAINPMRAPSFCANVGTGNIGIKHQAKAFNITLMNPTVAGLEAVVLGQKALESSRATSVFCGAMEDYSKFSIGSDCDVSTVGGALVLKLETIETAASDEIMGFIGPGFDMLVSQKSMQSQGLQARLSAGLSSLMADDDEDIAICVSMQTSRHSDSVLELLKQSFSKLGVSEASFVVPTSENRLGTILSLAQLGWCAAHKSVAICLAISPLGHVTAIRISQKDKDLR